MPAISVVRAAHGRELPCWSTRGHKRAMPAISIKKWGGRWGSNPRPPESQSGALPTELRPPLFNVLHFTCFFRLQERFQPRLFPIAPVANKFAPTLARPAGLEPATPGLEGRCSIRLSYGRFVNSVTGRGGGIRTPDPLLPKQLRYQAALHPDKDYSRAMLRSSGQKVNAKMRKSWQLPPLCRVDN